MSLDTPRKIIEALGGITAVAELTGAKYSRAAKWNTQEQFPANTYLVLQRALRRRGLSAPDRIWKMICP